MYMASQQKITDRFEKKSSTDYIAEAISFFKAEYAKVKTAGLTYEYPLGENFARSNFEPELNEINHAYYRRIAVERLQEIGLVTECEFEERVTDDYGTVMDYAICKIDENRPEISKKTKITTKPVACYITKEGDDFYYNGQHILATKEGTDYYKVLSALYAKLPNGGDITYKDLIREIRNRMPETKSKTDDEMHKLIQGNLTDRNNGFMRYANIPETESNGKALVSIIRGTGVRFNNKKG